MRWKRTAGSAGGALAALLAALAASSSPAGASGPLAHITRVGSAPPSQSISLVFPLLADHAGLARFARSVSTPGSVSYGQFEPIAQLSARFGASARTRRHVLAYLHRVGATGVKIDRTGLFADASLTARLAERLFATPLARFSAAHSTRFIAPTAPAAIPPGLRGLVSGVIGLDTRPVAGSNEVRREPARVRASVAESRPTSALPRTGTVSADACSGGKSAGELAGDPTTAGFTPNQYLSAYGFDPLHNAGINGQGERVALIEIDGFAYSDINAFAQCFHLGPLPVLNGFGVGVQHKLAPGGEATLDLEVLDAAAPDLKAIDVYESRPNAAAALRALTAPLQNPGFKPQVISASLGLCEPTLFGAVGSSGIRSAEAALAMATATGITFLAASGDQGSADCTTQSGDPVPSRAVNYPASSWWVTGVGGTNFSLNAANQITRQLVWNDTSVQPGSAAGGGASILLRRPSYQNGTVQASARAVPDVSMLADILPGYAIFCTATAFGDCSRTQPWEAIGGTSAATPLLAGAFALVDQQLRINRRADLGLVNPLLYRIGRSSLAASVFSDVLKYDNDVGPDVASIGRSLGCCRAGAGFDEASGWGSVDVASFANRALLTQPARVALSIPAHQRPVRNHKILATVSCSLSCRMGAIALVQIGSSKPFEIASRVHRIHAAGRKKIALVFSSRQLQRLRSALSRHQRIESEIFGVTLTATDHIQTQTSGQFLRIKD